MVARKLFAYENPVLEQTIKGIHFPKPIGLAAGFDKNEELTDILPEVGSFSGEVVEQLSNEFGRDDYQHISEAVVVDNRNPLACPGSSDFANK